MIALAAFLVLSQDPLSEPARAAAGQAVEIVDGWTTQASKLEERLRELAERAAKLREAQELLDAAVASRDAARLREAIAAWSPAAAGKLGSVAEIEQELKRLNPASGGAGAGLEEALLHFGSRARELNARELQAWRASGLAGRIERALGEKGRLREAIELGRKIKQTWEGNKEPAEKYDEALRDIDGLFDPAARDAAAELRAVQRRLEGIGTGTTALQTLEARLRQQALQMHLLRPLEAPKDAVLAEVRRKFQDETALTEIRSPDFVKGRLFHARADRHYLLTPNDEVQRLDGPLDAIRRAARLLRLAGKEPDPETLASTLQGFEDRVRRAEADAGPDLDACREPLDLVEAYLNLQHAGDAAAARKALEDARRFHRRGSEEALANAMFNDADRDLLRATARILRSAVIVEIAASGEGLSLWARADDGSPTALARTATGGFAGLVAADPERHASIFIGGAQGGVPIRESMERMPQLPGRVSATLRPALRPKEPATAGISGGPVNLEQLLKLNAGGPKSAPASEDAPPTTAEKDEMKVRAGIDTDRGVPPDETAAKFGSRPGALDDPGFAGLLEKLIEGDRAAAEAILQRVTGCSAERARKDVDRLLGEDKTRKANEEKGKPAKVPYAGPRPGPDGDYLRSAGVNPADVAVPVDPSVIPDAPRSEDLRLPLEQPAAGNPFDSYRRTASALPHDFLRRQQSAVDAERRAAVGVIRDRTIPTRGGLDNIDAGAAKSIVLSLWDADGEDGDIVRVSVGGKLIASALALTATPQSFTIELSDPFTPLSIVALNEGTTPSSTGSIKASAGGRDLRVSSWTLKANGVATSVIRRGGAP